MDADKNKSTHWQNLTWEGNALHWKITGIGVKGKAFFTVNMVPGYQYMLVMYQPFKGGSMTGGTNPANNLLSFSLPGDSIYGQVACKPAPGSFTFNPITTLKVTGNTGDKTLTSTKTTHTGATLPEMTTTASPGDTITFTHTVQNNGGNSGTIDTKSPGGASGSCSQGAVPESSWKGVWDRISISSAADYSCTFHSPASTSPKITIAGNYAKMPLKTGYNRTLTASDLGKKICSQTYVTPYKTGDDGEIHSQKVCVKVVPPPVTPTVQFLGYDARIGGDASTATMIKVSGASTTLYGSWSEYGALINGTNTDDQFTSGAAIIGGSPNTLPFVADRSMLTFANNNDPSLGDVTGNWGGNIDYDTSLVNRLESMCDTQNTVPLRSLGGAYDGSKPLCNLGGTVRITSNISLSGGPAVVGPATRQIVIMAKNIIIAPTVTNIGAWLVAVPTDDDPQTGGLINTCYENNITGTNNGANDTDFKIFAQITNTSWQQGANNGGTDNCKNALTITGPVMSRGVYLNRTTNPSSGSGDIAGETFNLRADAFIWAYNGGSGGASKSVAQTVSIKELPPRF